MKEREREEAEQAKQIRKEEVRTSFISGGRVSTVFELQLCFFVLNCRLYFTVSRITCWVRAVVSLYPVPPRIKHWIWAVAFFVLFFPFHRIIKPTLD